jgi:hypothetical protein
VDASAPPVDGTAPSDAGPADLGPEPDGQPTFLHDAGYDDGGAPMPFTGANETWQGVTIPGTHCGNGSPMVVGVNLTTRSNDVVVYFQGGGACWDYTTCFQLGTASHATDTLTAADVTAEASGGTSFLFERNAQNPFQNASYVYIPYCTGDAHAGANVATFTDTSGGSHTMHFEGAHNTELVLEAMAATRPTTTHVFLVGASAGGYGVLANWWRAQEIFAGARVDALSDSGLPLDVPATRWRLFLSTWGFDLPPNCADCASIGDAVPYYARTMQPPHRFGLLAFLNDSVIPGFYGESAGGIRIGLLALRMQTQQTQNMRTFYVDMQGHVLMQTPDNLTAGASGPTVRAWITQFATDDPAWTDVGP